MLKLIISYLNIFRLFPHIFFYFFYMKNINSDIKRCKEHHLDIDFIGINGLLYFLTFDKSFRALFYYRIGIMSNLFSFLAPTYSNLLINSHCRIGEAALLVHSFSTIINPESIGSDFRISNYCIKKKKKGGRPIIKDNVTIHPGSIIFGPIIIGNNVVIGAGSVVSKSIPDNCIVIGNPAYIIKIDGKKVFQRL